MLSTRWRLTVSCEAVATSATNQFHEHWWRRQLRIDQGSGVASYQGTRGRNNAGQLFELDSYCSGVCGMILVEFVIDAAA
jgi:hypothetical protein